MEDLQSEMRNWPTKYIKKINLTIFLSYSLIILLSAFHHHNFNFNFIQSFEKQNNVSSNSLSLQFDSGIKCIVHHNYISLNSALITSSLTSQISKKNNCRIIISRFNSFYSNDNQRINQLRAPPLFS